MRKIVKYSLFALFSLIVTAGLTLSYILYWPFIPLSDAKEIDVIVPWGARFEQVTDTLKSRDIITDRTLFKITARLLGETQKLRAGKFTLHTHMSNNAALDALVHGPQSYFSITLPEGYASNRFAGIFHKELGLDSVLFMHLVTDSTFIKSLEWNEPSLEGYLYPETYHFTYGVTEEQVIRTLVQQFKETVPDSFWAAAEERGMSRREAVTLASIIEGEAMLDKEMPLISSVYHNRLKRGMRLQADPTIQYILPDGPRRLLNRDLRIDSPYNTYMYAGLPPGPINNPAVNAIRAAVYPSQTSFLYFVADGKGGHSFSRTLTQHLNAKRKFDQIRREYRRKQRESQGDE